MKFLEYYKWFEKTLGGLKFGISIILIFTAFLIWGTFVESYSGADYANRLVYKSVPFITVQCLMFLSILFATLLRLPPKVRLYGFYTLHLGLLLIFIGSFVTYWVGIDGSISLEPNTTAKDINLNDDAFIIQDVENQNEIIFNLPYSAFAKDINQKYDVFTLKDYYPFAALQMDFLKSPKELRGQDQSSEYDLKNENVGQKFLLSLNPEADAQSTLTLGPLSIHYMPQGLSDCFKKQSVYVIWNALNNHCDVPTSINKKKNNFITYHSMGETINFSPDTSPLPLKANNEFDEKSYWRVFSKKLFEEKPHLFLFGESAAFFEKETKTWKVLSLTLNQSITLPWMGFQLKLTKHYPNQYPVNIPIFEKPLQDNGNLIKGKLKAVKVQIENKDIWVTSEKPTSLLVSGKKYHLILGKKKISLPFEMILKNFKMDFDPGTNNPASYESFINMFSGTQTESAHIFMNNPLKKNGFTFYQASYFQMNNEQYGSVLSVNYDPGRPIKYFGSFLLVFGTIWYYFSNRKRWIKNAT
jgi:hypothetical protein